MARKILGDRINAKMSIIDAPSRVLSRQMLPIDVVGVEKTDNESPTTDNESPRLSNVDKFDKLDKLLECAHEVHSMLCSPTEPTGRKETIILVIESMIAYIEKYTADRFDTQHAPPSVCAGIHNL